MTYKEYFTDMLGKKGLTPEQTEICLSYISDENAVSMLDKEVGIDSTTVAMTTIVRRHTINWIHSNCPRKQYFIGLFKFDTWK